MFLSKSQILGLLVTLLLPIMKTQAVENWQQDYEQGNWSVDKSIYQCRLVQHLEGIATASISREPETKSQLRLALSYPEGQLSSAVATLKNADWQVVTEPQKEHLLVGKVEQSSVFFEGSDAQLLEGIAKGQWLEFLLKVNNRPHRFIFTNIDGLAAVTEYRQCLQAMAPISWKTARESTFYFDTGKKNIHSRSELKRVRDIVSFIHLDKKVSKVLIDGYTDNVGNHIANRQLSQQRADDVASRLLEAGLAASMIEVRAHGSRYPVINNTKDKGLNRRVTVRLIRKNNSVVKK